MKRIILFLAVCLGLSVFQTDAVFGANNQNTSSKRDSSTVVSTTQRSATNARQKSDKNRTNINTQTKTKSTVSRSTGQTKQQTRGTTDKQSVVSRTTKKPTTATRQSTSATKPVTVSRAAATQKVTSAKSISSRSATNTKKSANVSRVTALDKEKITAIKSKDYSKCKTVYFECMDEFCANKDANLRRCACSSRIHEFDNVKKQLNSAADKMTDFNQRLLIVGMDKEDAAAINSESEGEAAFNTKDKSESEKLLQKIVNSLNGSGDSKLDGNLASISLSLDMDSAWDSVDGLAGAATTSKSGVDLYNAAQPICVQMAKEVCSKEELNIAQSTYTLTIQQDCDTVAKSYNTQVSQAKDKIHESSALLDMSRLNAYQQRNSDDILTCKKKILEQLSDESVCGTDLYKCLDTSGQFIDPSTGEAFLSKDLHKITELLTKPTGDMTWSKMPQNEKFVSFLNSKKTFLKTATEQCQDLSETVWKEFLDDALAQIKLAQNKKLETLRQSCTTLVAECKIGKMKNLSDFDSRAMSTFSVLADTTVNQLCSSVQSACASLLKHSGGGEDQWDTGMTNISIDASYEKILETCTTVGKDCIIRQCNGTSGNFALCKDSTSTQRRSILTRQVCWDEIEACIKQSSNLENIKNIDTTIATNYCPSDSGKECFITEKIWGGCEHDPEITAINTVIYNNENKCDDDQNPTACASNKIIMPSNEESQTLLSWFAHNTGTIDNIDSCSAYKCPINYHYDNYTDKCYQFTEDSKDEVYGGTPNTSDEVIYVTSELKNYCPGGKSSMDKYGNCCTNGFDSTGNIKQGYVSNGICVPYANSVAIPVQNVTCNKGTNVLEAVHPDSTYYSSHEPDSEKCNDLYLTNFYESEEGTINDNAFKYDNASAIYYCPIKITQGAPVANDNNNGKCDAHLYSADISYAKKLELYCISAADEIERTGNTIQCYGNYVLVDQYGHYMELAHEETYSGNLTTVSEEANSTFMYFLNRNNPDGNNRCIYGFKNDAFNTTGTKHIGWTILNGPNNTSACADLRGKISDDDNTSEGIKRLLNYYQPRQNLANTMKFLIAYPSSWLTTYLNNAAILHNPLTAEPKDAGDWIVDKE